MTALKVVYVAWGSAWVVGLWRQILWTVRHG